MILNPKDLQEIIKRIHNDYHDHNSGRLADYIPELAKADPKNFAISITTVDGESFSVGDYQQLFTIQSISKPFIFGHALQRHGLKKVRTRVGVEPTGDPFNSLIRLQEKSKRPSNPLVNTGAIAMTNLVGKKHQEIDDLFENLCGRKLNVDQNVYESEKMTGHRNRAMAHLMLHFNMVDQEVEKTLDLYFRHCSYQITSVDLSLMGATLASWGINPLTKKKVFDRKHIKHILTLMFTCGLYTYAGEWAFNVGIPGKSGVSGGIMAVIPGMMGISVYSPLIDHHGNSVRGIKVFKDLSKVLKMHIFE